MAEQGVIPQAALLTGVGQIAVPVREVERATTFYRDALGLTYLFSAPQLAFFDCGGVRLMLSIPEPSELNHHSSIIYLRCGEIHTAYALLQSRGVKFKDAPHLIARLPDHELWMAFFDDTEGNTLALMSEIRD
ncbi:MAG TPA: VOC family protein [Gemmatimonadales bacterium]|jgi:methylmalonyl-CoA/ethylmalonyl-CoA epimerase